MSLDDQKDRRNIDDLRAGWERLGEQDPLWAVLTDPTKRGRRWTYDEFLAAGETEIKTVFDHLAELGLDVKRGRALDFGCGTGRLTQALARRFERVDGVDIAQAMLTGARALDPPDNISFHHNAAPHLKLFADDAFDFVYSSIVLQHVPPQYQLSYVNEFLRVTRPGGLVVFQAPHSFAKPPRTVKRLVSKAANDARVKLALRSRLRGVERPAVDAAEQQTLAAHCLSEGAIRSAASSRGGRILDVVVTNSLDEDFNGRLVYLQRKRDYGWTSHQYVIEVLTPEVQAAREA